MSYCHLSSEERYVISHLVLYGLSLREIGRRLQRHHATISREINRNRPTYADDAVYWYDAATAGTLLGTGNSFTPTNPSSLAAGSYEFYAECIDADGCTTGNRTTVSLTINAVPVAPIQTDLEICEESLTH